MRQWPTSSLALEQAEHGLGVADVDGEAARRTSSAGRSAGDGTVTRARAARRLVLSSAGDRRTASPTHRMPPLPAQTAPHPTLGRRTVDRDPRTHPRRRRRGIHHRVRQLQPAQGGLRRRGRRQRRRGARARARQPVRPRRARRHAARHRRLRGLPPPARRVQRAGAVPLGARHGARQGRRPRDRRRRLPRQAVRRPRAAGARQGAAAPRAAGSREAGVAGEQHRARRHHARRGRAHRRAARTGSST